MNYNELIAKCKVKNKDFIIGVHNKYNIDRRMVGVYLRKDIVYWFEEVIGEEKDKSIMIFYKSHSIKNGGETYGYNTSAYKIATKFLENN